MHKTKIRVLDEHTINQIAAGEVIENPSSVVKELVENAIDAGSTEITVEIAAGGRQLIRVSDNGCGMSSDDAILCLERHATSKIKQVGDIFEVSTMGFRGEAVPSIAAISKFSILTCPLKEGEKNLNGTMVIVDGGKLITTSPAARSPGTTIEVKSLFFNVPVRKKFQKSPAYDTQEILKMLTVLSLGFPTIKFELISDQKQLLSTPLLPPDHSRQEQLTYRIENVLGHEFLHQLCPVSFEQENYSLQGFVGMPGFHRQNRSGQYLFINQRAVQSHLISFAVREGYNTMLPTNRHPVYILHLHMHGELIDVNVHPQKKEVRFRQELRLKEAVCQATQKALQNTGFTATVPDNNWQSAAFTDIPEPSPIDVPPFVPSYESIVSAPVIQAPLPMSHFIEAPLIRSEPPKIQPQPTFFDRAPSMRIPRIVAQLPGYILLDLSSVPSQLISLPEISVEGLCLLSQKAAFSRIYYEKMLHQQAEGPGNVQSMLIPITIETAPMDAALLKEHLSVLNGLGIGIKEFGEHTFIVDAIPDFLKENELESFLMAIVDDLKELQDSRRVQREKEKCIASAASRQAKSMNRRLSPEEANGFLRQLMDCKMPSQCPLGKPTVIYLSSEDLAKLFQKGALFK